MALGSFCLVLHGHLPYVLHHGTWPHGEDWLYEAVAETYLPLLAVLDECAAWNSPARLTVGLTPVLLEQLAHEHFKLGFERYLADRVARAQADRKAFEKQGETHLAYLASRWQAFYEETAAHFERLGRDIPAAFAERAGRGWIEILTSCATHAYLPLLLEDSSVRAQLRAGAATSQRVLGRRPTGIWLPENAYRPTGPWRPAIDWGGARDRPGTDRVLTEEGFTHFFVEHRLIEQCRSEWVRDGPWRRVDGGLAERDPARGWRSVHEPVGVAGDGDPSAGPVAFARDPRICEQVWSGAVGYPADGVYLEFHKKHGEKRGLRYWKITSTKTDLGGKAPYYPDDVAGKIHEHAQHFCGRVRETLAEHQRRTGREGVVVACFDAELFGHWWFEGARFLRDVCLTLNADPDVTLATAGGYLAEHPIDKSAWLPEGSWGEEGDHRVWTNPKVAWMWEIEYRCEMLFGRLTFHLPWRKRDDLRRMLEKAARELLLLQASDWPFVISRSQAVDYGIKRFMQHVSRFECLADIAECLASNSQYLSQLNEVERFEIQDAEIHDVIFPQIDLNWWNV